MNKFISHCKGFLLAVFIGHFVGEITTEHLIQQNLIDCEETGLTPKSTQNNEPTPQSKPFQRFIYVGVMTTVENLATRGSNLWETWGKEFPGEVEFYVGGRNITERYKNL